MGIQMAQLTRVEDIFQLAKTKAPEDLSFAYGLVRDGAKYHKLWSDSVRRDLAKIRQLAYEQHDREQANFVLTRTAQRLSALLQEEVKR